jgi:hypothetical protein
MVELRVLDNAIEPAYPSDAADRNRPIASPRREGETLWAIRIIGGV